eukprot:scaffold300_cov144-Isochrysis_galbana.AAC.8
MYCGVLWCILVLGVFSDPVASSKAITPENPRHTPRQGGGAEGGGRANPRTLSIASTENPTIGTPHRGTEGAPSAPAAPATRRKVAA